MMRFRPRPLAPRRGFCVLFAAIFAALNAPAVATGQGTLSTQGFGYPPGQMSSRALGTAGAMAGFDAQSPLNPAALAEAAAGSVGMQYDPEFRTVTGPDGKSRSTTARFNNVSAVLPAGSRWFVGLSASSLLDRTWATAVTGQDSIGNQLVPSTERVTSTGGITDLRLGVARVIGTRLSLGIGVHGYTGSNKISVAQSFPDTLSFGRISQNTVVNYRGSAVSAGVDWKPVRSVGIAVSARNGGSVSLRTADTLLSTARIPDRYAASLRVTAGPGVVVALRAARDHWSSLTPLSTSGARAVDALDLSAGVELSAQRLAERGVVLRLGARRRDLPFEAAGAPVREMVFAGGLGVPFARDRSVLDFAIQRAARSAAGNVRESAYQLSIGLRVRP